MKFILHSNFSDETIRDNLGAAEYSYYFVLKAFRPVLAELGSVEVIRQPEIEVDAIYKSCLAQGEDCVFLFFGPPHKTPLGLACPTVPVIAWEFSTIPTEVWDNDRRNDWRYPLARCGRAIALSTYSANVIEAAVGPSCRVSAIPAPVSVRESATPFHPTSSKLDLHFNSPVFDTAGMDFPADVIGTIGRTQRIEISRHQRALRRGLIWGYAVLERLLQKRHSVEQLRPDRTPDEGDRPADLLVSAPLPLNSIIYTSVLNPTDGRKNIHDMVLSFCWAFRDVEDATLVLKLVSRDPRHFYSALISTMHQMSPFKCRVVAFNDFLENSEYSKLIDATSYYVNASTSEGLCMPLMEFMAAGRPAIAPVHTAMADYINDEAAFTIRATRQITVWPHDPRDLFRTMCFRVDLGSLIEAFQRSYRLAKDRPASHAEMGLRARHTMLAYASPEVVKGKVRQFFSIDTPRVPPAPQLDTAQN